MIIDRHLSFRSVTISVRRENLVFFALSLLITLFYRRMNFTVLSLAVTPFTILGAAITIFLGFRTNTAYDRWWEARTLWGGMVNQSRTLVRQVLTFGGSSLPEQDNGASTNRPASPDDVSSFTHKMARMQIAFVNATRLHLRKQDAGSHLESYLSLAELKTLQGQQNIPSAILLSMAMELRKAFRLQQLDTIQFAALDATLAELTNILGACERIKNTPLPRQYDTIPQFAIYIYSLFLPLGLVASIGWWTPFVSSMITFIFFAIDSIGSNIEDPFENKIHDVPMSTLCRTIEINLLQLIGEKELPSALEPTHGVLL